MNQAKYNEMVEEIAQAVDAGSLSVEEADSIMADAQAQLKPENPTLMEQVKDVGGTIGKGALDYGMRAADYAGGLARTFAAANLEHNPLLAVPRYLGKEYLGMDTSKIDVGKEDIKKTLLGQAPGMSEYYQRAGMPEGPATDLPAVGEAADWIFEKFGSDLTEEEKAAISHLSTRQLTGLVSDIGLDPLTYASGGTAALAKIKNFLKTVKVPEQIAKGVAAGVKIAKTPERILEGIGNKIYSSGLRMTDLGAEMSHRGKKAVSSLLRKKKIYGKRIDEQAQRLDRSLSATRTNLRKKAPTNVDTGKMFDNIIAEGEKLKAGATKAYSENIDKALNKIEQLKQSGAYVPDEYIPQAPKTTVLKTKTILDPSDLKLKEVKVTKVTPQEPLLVKGQKPWSATKAEKERRHLNKRIKWNPEAATGDAEDLLVSAERKLNSEIAKSTGNPGLYNKIGAEQSLLKQARSEFKKIGKREVQYGSGVSGTKAFGAKVNPAATALGWGVQALALPKWTTRLGHGLSTPAFTGAVGGGVRQGLLQRRRQADRAGLLNYLQEQEGQQ